MITPKFNINNKVTIKSEQNNEVYTISKIEYDKAYRRYLYQLTRYDVFCEEDLEPYIEYEIVSIMNKEDFVTFEQAIELKKLGFNWPTHCHYHEEDETDNVRYSSEPLNWNNCTNLYSAPELHIVQKWLREVKHISIEAIGLSMTEWESRITNLDTEEVLMSWCPIHSYEEALSTAITEYFKLETIK